jgi:hypothetical protein
MQRFPRRLACDGADIFRILLGLEVDRVAAKTMASGTAMLIRMMPLRRIPARANGRVIDVLRRIDRPRPDELRDVLHQVVRDHRGGVTAYAAA